MLVDEILSNYDDKFVAASSGLAGYKIRDNSSCKSFGNRLCLGGFLAMMIYMSMV